MLWKLLALVLPLGLDTFAVAAALALAGKPAKERLRVSARFTAFAAGRPIVGLLVGAAAGQAVIGIADYVATAALLLPGASMLWPREEEERPAARFAPRPGDCCLAVGP